MTQLVLAQCHETPQVGSGYARLRLPVLIVGTADGNSPRPSWKCFPLYSARHRHEVCKASEWGVQGNFFPSWVLGRAKNSGGEVITTVLMPSTGRGDSLHGGMAMPAITRTRHQHDPYQASAQPLTGIVTNAPPILQTQRWQSGLALCVSVSLCWKKIS